MKIDKTEVFGFDAALRGMRNPMNSWNKSDSYKSRRTLYPEFIIGPKDLELAHKLIVAGTEHSKFLRFITVWADIEAPLYFWKEYDTYKHGEKNSCSTMHSITSRPLTKDDFEWDECNLWQSMTVDNLNDLIEAYKKETNKLCKMDIFREIIQDLPSAYLQKRTITTNYAELRNMRKQRENHRLIEWHKVVEWIDSLEYSELLK